MAPLLRNGTVYAGFGDTLYAVSPIFGGLNWQLSGLEAGKSPVVTGERMIAAGAEGLAYGVAAGDGRIQWEYDFGRPITSSLSWVPSVSNVFFTNRNDLLFALYQNSTEQYRVTTPESTGATTPGHAAGRLYFRAGSNVVTVRGDSEPDVNDLGVTVTSPPIVTSGNVYVSTTDGILALDDLAFTEQWEQSEDRYAQSELAVDEDTVYAVHESGVSAFAVGDGTERWQTAVDTSPLTAVSVTGDGVYVGGAGTVVGLARDDGSQRWQYAVDGTVSAPPMVANGVVYAATNTGRLYALHQEQQTPTPQPQPQTTRPRPADTATPTRTSTDTPTPTPTPTDTPTPTEAPATESERDTDTPESSIAPSPGDVDVETIGLGVLALGTVAAAAGHVRSIGSGGGKTATLSFARGVDGWQMPGGTAGQTAAAPTVVGPVSGPSTAWQKLPEKPVDSAPAVGQNQVIVHTTDDEIVAFDPRRGEQLWTRESPGERLTDPTVYRTSVYFGSRGGVVAHNVATGEYQWMGGDGPTTTPVISAEDRLFVGTGDALVVLDPTTGDELWRASVSGGVDALAVAGGTVYTVQQDGIVAYDTAGGDERLRADTPGRLDSIAVDGLVVATGPSGVVAIDPDSGEQRWTTDDGTGPSGVALTDRRVYYATRESVVARDAETGSRVWRTPLDAHVAPVIVGETLYVGTDADLAALSTSAGEYDFTHPVEGVVSRPAVAGNALFVQTVDGSLIVVTGTLASGSPNPSTGVSDRESERTVTDSETRQAAESQPSNGDPAVESGAGSEQTGGRATAATSDETVTDRTDVSAVADLSGPVQDAIGIADGAVEQFERVSSRSVFGVQLPWVVADVVHADREPHRIVVVRTDPDEAVPTAVQEAFSSVVRRWRGIAQNRQVATVRGSGASPRPWVVFEGGDRDCRALEGATRKDRVDVIADVAEALRTGKMYNVSHHSLEPVAVGITGDSPRATVGDWGLSTRLFAVADTDRPVTPYTAPEQLDGETSGVATDIYRLGAVGYRVLAGTPPFDDATDLESAIRAGKMRPLDEVNTTLPETISAAISRAMDPDPEARQHSPYELKQQLLAALD